MFTNIFVQLLQNTGTTSYRVAKETRISQGLMGQYFRGEKLPTMQNLVKIADYFKVSTDYLLGRTENPMIATPLSAKINPADEERQGTVQGGDVINIFEERIMANKITFPRRETWELLKFISSLGEVYGNDKKFSVMLDNLAINRPDRKFDFDVFAKTFLEYQFDNGRTLFSLSQTGSETLRELDREFINGERFVNENGIPLNNVVVDNDEHTVSVNRLLLDIKESQERIEKRFTSTSQILSESTEKLSNLAEISESMPEPDDPNHGDAQ